MRSLTGELLLEAWQLGAGEPYHGRALSMLLTACPERAWGELADLSIAERDRELLRLRGVTFGNALRGCAPCEACDTAVEFEIAVSAMIDHSASRLSATWTSERFTFTMHPATSRDLIAVSAATDPRRSLILRCTSGDSADSDVLAICEEIALEQFNSLNDDAEIRLTLPCPACGAVNRAELDIVRFLWTEVKRAAKALLQEVHDLAKAYGWSEASILAMNPARRAMYLELASI